MEKTIAVLGGDKRMALLARLLAEDGCIVRTWGLAAFGAEETPLEEAVGAERIVLPVPLSRGKNLNCAAAEAQGLKCISAQGLPGKAAPETAARAICATLKKIWEEEA